MDWLLIPAIIALGLSNQNSAARSTAEAYARHLRADQFVNEYVERKVSPELRAHVGKASWLTKTVVEQKVVFQWTF
jgi:hypothetical protein